MRDFVVFCGVVGFLFSPMVADSGDVPPLLALQRNPVAPYRREVQTPPPQAVPLPLQGRLMNVSAYTASVRECGKADGITASGVKARAGRTVASDDLPFGTVVRIKGREYVVEDRFGGGYRDRLDIFMEEEDEAWEFGRQWVEVEIVR